MRSKNAAVAASLAISKFTGKQDLGQFARDQGSFRVIHEAFCVIA
jgi:hypothetical protein